MSNENIKRAKEAITLQAERIYLKTMADYVKEYIIDYCDKDPDFAQRINDPEKSFMECIAYIKKQALGWLKEQQKLELSSYSQGVGGDVPNEICYQWAIEYYYSKPEPKPEPKKVDKASSTKTKSNKKGAAAKDKEETKNNQISFAEFAPDKKDEAEPISLFDNEKAQFHSEEEEDDESFYNEVV